MDWACFEARRRAIINGTMYSELFPFILQENVRTFGRELNFKRKRVIQQSRRNKSEQFL